MQNKNAFFIFIAEVQPTFDYRSKVRLKERKAKFYMSFSKYEQLRGRTYCSFDCVLEAENTTLTEIDRELHNADEVDSECYYTEWY